MYIGTKKEISLKLYSIYQNMMTPFVVELDQQTATNGFVWYPRAPCMQVNLLTTDFRTLHFFRS